MTDRKRVQLDNLHLEELLELLPEHLKKELLNTVNCCLVRGHYTSADTGEIHTQSCLSALGADRRVASGFPLSIHLKSSFVGASTATSRSPRPTTSNPHIRGGTPQMAPAPINTKKYNRDSNFNFSVFGNLGYHESDALDHAVTEAAILPCSPHPNIGSHVDQDRIRPKRHELRHPGVSAPRTIGEAEPAGS
uniref:Uncharacterized protein n=1 Tax=Timema poppense TaxID=170557 RepID=A0A7R9DP04_TIMPO|nr:unnamed protein product [Timema poppensis]